MHVFLTLTCIKVYLGTVSTKLGAKFLDLLLLVQGAS